MASLSKASVFAAVVDQIERDAAAVLAAQKATHAGAVHSEAKQEGSKDTRAIEAGYLARGLAERAEQLQEALQRLRTFRLPLDLEVGGAGALVELCDATERRLVFLLPWGGGLTVTVDGERVSVVSPKAPLGRALIGAEVDDEVTVRSPRGARSWEVTALQ